MERGEEHKNDNYSSVTKERNSRERGYDLVHCNCASRTALLKQAPSALASHYKLEACYMLKKLKSCMLLCVQALCLVGFISARVESAKLDDLQVDMSTCPTRFKLIYYICSGMASFALELRGLLR